MQRIAVFVDAGYIFAIGGQLLSGSRQDRANLSLDIASVVSELKQTVASRAPHAPLLRIYWYDTGSPATHTAAEQVSLANSDDVKLRLGHAQAFGLRKGAAFLIGPDLIELARNHGICDALVVSGDEHLRAPIQLAQSYGVRAHVLGIGMTRSGPTLLSQEADTTLDWDVDAVQRFLSVRRCAITATFSANPPPRTAVEPTDWEARLETAARELADSLEDRDLDALETYWTTSRGVPSELDRRLLPVARTALGRDLDHTEKRYVRSCFQRNVMMRYEDEFEEV